MIADETGSLVRITAGPNGATVGTGFIFDRESEHVRVLTCRKVAAKSSTTPNGPTQNAWIEGKYEAAWEYATGESAADLTVLSCPPELKDGNPLRLGWTIRVPTAKIAFDAGIESGAADRRSLRYKRAGGGDVNTSLVLWNNLDFPIGGLHHGSPVMNENWAIGVVVDHQPDPNGDARGLVLAIPVERLRGWKESKRLIMPPFQRAIAQNLSSPIQSSTAAYARILVSVSDPSGQVDLFDEIAVIQETIRRQAPPGSAIELWQWGRAAGPKSTPEIRRIYPGPLGPGSEATPSIADFDAVVLVIWSNLGGKMSGGIFAIEHLINQISAHQGRRPRLSLSRKLDLIESTLLARLVGRSRLSIIRRVHAHSPRSVPVSSDRPCRMDE